MLGSSSSTKGPPYLRSCFPCIPNTIRTSYIVNPRQTMTNICFHLWTISFAFCKVACAVSSQAIIPIVAVRLVRTGFEFMRTHKVFESFNIVVIHALGTRDAVDIFINTDSSEFENRKIDELKRLFAVLIERALDATALQSLSSDVCPERCDVPASTSRALLVCITCAAQRSSFGWRRATVKSEKHERNKDFRYDWIVHVRPDTSYSSPIIHSKITFQ